MSATPDLSVCSSLVVIPGKRHPRGRSGTNDSWRRERTEAQRTGGPGRWGGLRTLPDKLQLKASARWEGAGLLLGTGSAHKASAQDRPSQQAEKLTAAGRDRDVAGPRPAVRVPRQDAKRPRQRQTDLRHQDRAAATQEAGTPLVTRRRDANGNIFKTVKHLR